MPFTPEQSTVSDWDNPIPKAGSMASLRSSVGTVSGKSWARPDRLWMPFWFSYENEVTSESLYLTLFVNPESFTQVDPGRVTITQTKGGAFVDHFGPGLILITIAGVTGYRNRQIGNSKISGQEHFLELRAMIRRWWEEAQQTLYSGKVHLKFYNLADAESFEVATAAVNLSRSVGRPLLYQYNIQMTCIKQYGTKAKKQELKSWEEWESFLGDQGLRPPIAYNKLNSETGYLRGLLNKVLDVTKLSEGSQSWLTLINKGKEFYDTINKVYKTIDSEIAAVEQLSKDIGMFVGGVTSFVTRPFELVRDTAIALGDVVHEMCSVVEIPHELVRSFREMQCAINSFPTRIFQGFSNPYLFEGESNCGATLGIGEAPVASFDNSFTATAQVAPERNVSQIFTVPQLKLTLKEEPLSVSGIYVETDTSRMGINYLESWTGKTVNLTSVPNQAIVVDFKVLQVTTTEKIVLQATKARVIQDGDTIERIAGYEYGDPTRWKEIVLYNNLEYPFIEDNSFVKEYKSTGYVRFYRNTGSGVIPPITAGTKLWVPPYQGTNQIDFEVTTTTIVPLSEAYKDVPVRSILAGAIGNVAPNRITGFNPIAGINRVSNVSGTTNGKSWRVMKPGDVLQIPTSETTASSPIVGTGKSYEELFGVDLALNAEGELEAGTEGEPDIKRVFGIDNLVQALENRLRTDRGFYVYHTEYGSDLPDYIGKKNIPYWQDVVTMDIKNVCLVDPRIENIKEFLMEVDGDTITIDLDATPINKNTAISLNLIV